MLLVKEEPIQRKCYHWVWTFTHHIYIKSTHIPSTLLPETPTAHTPLPIVTYEDLILTLTWLYLIKDIHTYQILIGTLWTSPHTPSAHTRHWLSNRGLSKPLSGHTRKPRMSMVGGVSTVCILIYLCVSLFAVNYKCTPALLHPPHKHNTYPLASINSVVPIA